jgi:hypothetical protein
LGVLQLVFEHRLQDALKFFVTCMICVELNLDDFLFCRRHLQAKTLPTQSGGLHFKVPTQSSVVAFNIKFFFVRKLELALEQKIADVGIAYVFFKEHLKVIPGLRSRHRIELHLYHFRGDHQATVRTALTTCPSLTTSTATMGGSRTGFGKGTPRFGSTHNGLALGCRLRAGNSSPSIGGTSGTRLSTRSTSLAFARCPRASKYSTVNNAAAFSATAVAMN